MAGEGGQVTDWPAWATERVHVVPHEPAWQQRGAEQAAELDRLLSPWLVAPVEHVGSTAVPGLPAKPVLDLQAAVADLDVAPAVGVALAPAGWHAVPPELDGRPHRRLFVLVRRGSRAAHLHLLTADSPRWHEQLAFRDALRADPALAAAYGRVKAELADLHAADREAYTEGKSGFVRAALSSRAGAPAPTRRARTPSQEPRPPSR